MFYIISIIGLFIIIIFAISFFYTKSHIHNRDGVGNVTNNDENTPVSSKKNNSKKLTMQEKLELSWKFLYEITEIIINKFSKEDIDTLNKAGFALLSSGMRYEHVVDLGIKLAPSNAAFTELEQQKSAERDTGVSR